MPHLVTLLDCGVVGQLAECFVNGSQTHVVSLRLVDPPGPAEYAAGLRVPALADEPFHLFLGYRAVHSEDGGPISHPPSARLALRGVTRVHRCRARLGGGLHVVPACRYLLGEVPVSGPRRDAGNGQHNPNLRRSTGRETAVNARGCVAFKKDRKRRDVDAGQTL